MEARVKKYLQSHSEFDIEGQGLGTEGFVVCAQEEILPMDGHNHLFLPYMGVSQVVPSQGKVSTVLGTTLLMDNPTATGQLFSSLPISSPQHHFAILRKKQARNDLPGQRGHAGRAVEPSLQSHTTSGLSDGLTLEQLHLIYKVWMKRQLLHFLDRYFFSSFTHF